MRLKRLGLGSHIVQHDITHVIHGSDPTFGVNSNFGGSQLLRPPARRARKPLVLSWAELGRKLNEKSLHHSEVIPKLQLKT